LSKFNTTTIPLLLEAGDFKNLQLLMLRNNPSKGSFFSYDMHTPKFDGDSWKAFYFRDVMDTFGAGVLKDASQ